MTVFLDTAPKSTFYIDFTHGVSKAQDTYGYPRLSMHIDGRKFSAVGFGYSLEERVIADWLNEVVIKSEAAQKRLAQLISESEHSSGYRILQTTESGYIRVKAGIGLDHAERLLDSLGLKQEAIYSSNHPNAYKTGYLVENIGF